MEENQERISETELLTEIRNETRKQVKFAKISAAFTGGIFVIIFIAAIILVPKVIVTLQHADQLIGNANLALADITRMSNSVGDMSKKVDQLVADNSEKLTESVEKLSSIDFAGLNKAIKDLQDAVGPFANLMNRWK